MRMSAVLLCALPGVAFDASAIYRSDIQNAVNNCQGALPSFEGALRKRPTALANEGANPSFLSCSLSGDEQGTGTRAFGVYLTNNSATATTTSCTFVSGIIGRDTLTYITKSLTLQPGIHGRLEVDRFHDNAGDNFSNVVNMSCALPPKVELNYTYRGREEAS